MWLFIIIVVVILFIVLIEIGSKHEKAKEEISADKTQQKHEPLDPVFRKALDQLRSQYDKELLEGKRRFFELAEPVMKVNVSKIGHENKYHYYDEPYIENLKQDVEVELEFQYGDSYEDMRDAYVVYVGNYEVGELSNSAVQKIEDIIGDFDKAAFDIAKIDDSKERLKIILNVYNKHNLCEIGHRRWKLDLRGVNYEGRDKLIREYNSWLCRLKPTTYEGDPAVLVVDALDRELGWIPKEHAKEVSNHCMKNRISEVNVIKVREHKEKMYADVELILKSYG